MALLQDLTVFGVTNLISDTFANNIFANGFHHNAHNNDDSVLLAGGGHKPIADFLPSTTVVNYVSQENSTTANWRGVILGYNNNASANTGISSTVSNVVYTTNNLTVQPSTGALSSKGRGTFVGVTSSSGFTSTSGDLIFNNVNHILWNSGSYHQRIFLTDDNTSGTAVFTFQQSANTGSTWTDLFTIKDNGTLLAGTNTVYHSGNYASHLYIGAANAAANATASNPYLKLYNTLDSTDTLKEQYQLSGSNDIKVDSDATGNITFSNKGRTVYFIVGTSTTAGTWLGSHPDITEYYDGLTVLYYINKAGASTTTLNINDLGAITCYYGGTTKLTSHYAVGSIVLLTYYDNGWRRCEYYSDSNYIAGQYYSRYKVHAQGYIGRYMLVMKCPDGTITGLSTTNNSTGTSKVMFTGPLLLDQVFYMAGTGHWTAGANMATNMVLYENYSLVDVRYTFNCGSTLVAYKPFFIVLNKGNDGYYYLDTTQPWQIDIPTTDSEKIYLKIGSCYDTYRVAFEAVKKAYIRRDGIFTEFHDNSEKILVTNNLSNNSYALVFESTNNNHTKYSYLYKTIGDGDTDPNGAGNGRGQDGIYWNPYLKSFWFGENSIAEGHHSHAEGHDNKAIGSSSHAEGGVNIARGNYSHAEGNSTKAIGEYSHVEGVGYEDLLPNELLLSGAANTTQYTLSLIHPSGQAQQDIIEIEMANNIIPFDVISYIKENGLQIRYAYVISNDTISTFSVNTTLNSSTITNDHTYTRINRGGVAFGNYSHVEGDMCNAIGNGSHSEGRNTRAIGTGSHSEGIGKNYVGNGIVPWQEEVQGLGMDKYGLIGIDANHYTTEYPSGENVNIYPLNHGISYGVASHSEGLLCNSIGIGSHAEGSYTIAYGVSSHSEGCHSIAVGGAAHAEGLNTIAYNLGHSEGYKTVAIGWASHASGIHNITYYNGEFACGSYNISTISPDWESHVIHSGPNTGQYANTLFTIGNGTSSSDRNNAVTVWNNGDMNVLGNISNSSDISRKHDIQDLGDDAITNLFATENGFIREFTWNESNKVSYGFIAQEIENYCPEAVSYDASGLKVVNYNAAFAKIIGSMYKKIKELENEIDILKNGNH